jgi:hypothetical protein
MIEQLEKLQPKVLKNGKTRSQTAKSAIAKGKTGERFFADKFTQYSGYTWTRIPNSGAYTGSSNRTRLEKLSVIHGLTNLGDIISPIELCNHYIVESKDYKDLPFHLLFDPGNCKQVTGWLDELLYDIESFYMYPQSEKGVIGFLCFKITRKGNFIVYNTGNITRNMPLPYNLTLESPYPHLTFSHEIKSKILQENGWIDIFNLCDFESFLKYNTSWIGAVS